MLVWWAVVMGLLWGGEIPTVSVGMAAAAACVAYGLGCAFYRVRRFAHAGAFFLLAVAWATFQLGPIAHQGPTVGPCAIEGQVARPPLSLPSGCVLSLREVKVDGQAFGDAPLAVYLGVDSCPNVELGHWVSLRGALRRGGAYQNPRPGLAQPARWYVSARHLELLEKGTVSLLDRMRSYVDGALHFEDPRTSALYRALLLGDRRAVTPVMREAFIDTGTAHLLAISGLHLAVVGWLFFRLTIRVLLWWPKLAQVGRPRAWAAGFTLVWIYLYLAVIDPTVATVRALIGMTVVLVGILLSRRTTPAHLLRLAALGVLLVDPTAAWGASFQLSFAAATAIVLVWPHLQRWKRWLVLKQMVPKGWVAGVHGLVAAWVVSAATAAATAPLGLAWFGQQALMGVPISVVAVPWMGCVVLPLGVFNWVASVCWPSLALWSAPLAEASLGLLVDGLKGWAQVLGSSHASAWPWAAGLTGTLMVLLLLHRLSQWRLALVLAVITTLQCVAFAPPKDVLRVSFLDVGHGDSTLLQLPGGRTVLVDTGGLRRGSGHEGDRIADQVLIPALRALGAAQIDLLVITHPDRDHMGAAARLAERVPVGMLWVPPCAALQSSMTPLVRRVVGQGGEVVGASQSEPMVWSGVQLSVLWPPPGILSPQDGCLTSSNDGGLVMAVRYAGRQVLLTADIGREVERLLVRRMGDALRTDVLKIPHHGSRSSSSRVFLQAVQPAMAVLSASRPKGGRRRVRMPPHAEVLKRYRDLGVPVWFTGRDGAIQVEIDAQGSVRSGFIARR
jgi:competence protein ComEC